jgi:hypothetical protein
MSCGGSKPKKRKRLSRVASFEARFLALLNVPVTPENKSLFIYNLSSGSGVPASTSAASTVKRLLRWEARRRDPESPPDGDPSWRLEHETKRLVQNQSPHMVLQLAMAALEQGYHLCLLPSSIVLRSYVKQWPTAFYQMLVTLSCRDLRWVEGACSWLRVLLGPDLEFRATAAADPAFLLTPGLLLEPLLKGCSLKQFAFCPPTFIARGGGIDYSSCCSSSSSSSSSSSTTSSPTGPTTPTAVVGFAAAPPVCPLSRNSIDRSSDEKHDLGEDDAMDIDKRGQEAADAKAEAAVGCDTNNTASVSPVCVEGVVAVLNLLWEFDPTRPLEWWDLVHTRFDHVRSAVLGVLLKGDEAWCSRGLTRLISSGVSVTVETFQYVVNKLPQMGKFLALTRLKNSGVIGEPWDELDELEPQLKPQIDRLFSAALKCQPPHVALLRWWVNNVPTHVWLGLEEDLPAQFRAEFGLSPRERNTLSF